ncbi:MAG: riboflavin synthase [Moorella sp. (in: firmicutes)]|uniref:riboflavin synthase n=1 Tax=Moorella sp. E308F TaxID=2572682 RepID=UPI0010FFBCB4|nr:riboflavin synthase [Moorella sp. E308F]MDK2815629.1 riboflavin synthase [Moorella sp. (in: firmicutes)]MDK2894185.1 riboflavin synthase [Moorella sp. (in: firmicutes)]GEA15098.1 riboflavin synthase subunit alpha [Moorella sp. E308F]
MFTGLVEEIGVVRRVETVGQGARLTIAARKVLSGTRRGDSIAVNGACLTVVELTPAALVAEVMAETLRVTTLGSLKAGDQVNLERALQLGERLGGHLVSGHVDGVGEIKTKRQTGIAWELAVAVPPGLERYIAPKGSLALDGTSLTVITVDGNMVTVGIIPHTARHTILGTKGPGDKVNIEVDLLARYLERLLTGPQEETGRKGLTVEFLAANGFI